jgi:hypothetical protein
MTLEAVTQLDRDQLGLAISESNGLRGWRFRRFSAEANAKYCRINK